MIHLILRKRLAQKPERTKHTPSKRRLSLPDHLGDLGIRHLFHETQDNQFPTLRRELVQGEAGDRRRRRNFLDLLEEVEETAGDVPLKEVGRRASLEAEREAIERVLFHTEWNRKQAAGLLGVSYKTLLQKIRECGLAPH